MIKVLDTQLKKAYQIVTLKIEYLKIENVCQWVAVHISGIHVAYPECCGPPMTNNNNGVNGSAGGAGEPASADMDSLEEMLRKVRVQ